MWQLENRTPFAAERGWVRDRDGAEVWLVAVKCTFDVLADGSTQMAGEQLPPLRVPEYHGEPGESSVKYDADLVLTKTATDITLVGHAYAPDGRATEVDAGFRIGSLEKVVRVVGDRVWTDGAASRPRPFDRMPLVYERAYGGRDPRSPHPDRDWDWRNPLGTGFAVSPDGLEGVRLPNIEYPGESLRTWQDRPRPAGLGPIPGHWQPRVARAGTYDEAWLRDRQPLVPDDFDDRFFQSTPDDQQTAGFLRGGEPVTLHNVTPEGYLHFRLPKIYLGFDTRFYDGTRQIHRTRALHSVILEPDVPRVSLVWHSALPCHSKVQKLQRTIITLKTPLAPAAHAKDEEAYEPA